MSFPVVVDSNSLQHKCLSANPVNFIDPTGMIQIEGAGFELDPVFTAPLEEATVTSAYGKRDPVEYTDQVTGELMATSDNHTGIDQTSEKAGSVPVSSMDSGVVSGIGYDEATKGYYAIIDHQNDYTSEYYHMDMMPVLEKGAPVKQGTTLGFMGNTGASTGRHLHTTVKKAGENIDPIAAMGGLPSGYTLGPNVRQGPLGKIYNMTLALQALEENGQEVTVW